MSFFCFLFLNLFPLLLVGQESLFPLNEKGKIAFEEEVQVEGLGKEALFVNAVNYFGKVKKAGERKARKPELDPEGLTKEGSFYVYKEGLFTPQIHGEVRYRIRIEPTGRGYTYSISDFVFIFYERNRYGQFAPVNGKVKPLEDEKYAGMQDLWLEHKKVTRKHIDQQIKELKRGMQEIPPGARGNVEELGEEMN